MKLLLENWREFLKEEQTYQIYCDMDGVLVDFVKGVVEQVNKDLKDSTIQSKEMIKLRKALEEAEEAKTTLHKVTMDYASLTDLRASKDRNSNQFKDILESLDPREAKILYAAKNKNLKMRGLSKKLAIEVWGDRIFN